MGLDRKLLPDRVLRLVSPEDRQRTGLPRPISEIEFRRHMTKSMKEQPRARQKIQAEGLPPLSEHLLTMAMNPPKQSKAVSKPVAKAVPKAHGARYSIPVVLAFFKEIGLPQPRVEFVFDPTRKWRFDFAFPINFMWPGVAVEVQGGNFSGGAHVRGAALLREYEKLNRAAVLGWRVIFVTPDQLCMTDTAETIRAALNA